MITSINFKKVIILVFEIKDIIYIFCLVNLFSISLGMRQLVRWYVIIGDDKCDISGGLCENDCEFFFFVGNFSDLF